MKKVKLDETKVTLIKNEIAHFYKFVPKSKDGIPQEKGIPMVRLKGNFYAGGFNLSKNKVKAVLDNVEELNKFVAGEYDKEINALTKEEILQP